MHNIYKEVMSLNFEDLETNKSTRFIDLFPKLVEEWIYEKNGSINPENLKPFSNKKVWWKCSKNYEWEASPNSRTTGKDRIRAKCCPNFSKEKQTSFPIW